MAVANGHGAWPVYYAWPMLSDSIFGSPDNWLNTHKADRCWPIIILLIGRNGQSRGQRALAGGVLDFTHRIYIPQCTLGFVKRNYYTIATVPVKQPPNMGKSFMGIHKLLRIAVMKQIARKPCAYFMGNILCELWSYHSFAQSPRVLNKNKYPSYN